MTLTLRMKEDDVQLKVGCTPLSRSGKIYLKRKRNKCVFVGKIQMENPDSGEEWRCYILTVSKVGTHTCARTCKWIFINVVAVT